MKPFNLSDEDKKELLKQHKEATDAHRAKQKSYKDGIQVTEKKEEKKS